MFDIILFKSKKLPLTFLVVKVIGNKLSQLLFVWHCLFHMNIFFGYRILSWHFPQQNDIKMLFSALFLIKFKVSFIILLCYVWSFFLVGCFKNLFTYFTIHCQQFYYDMSWCDFGYVYSALGLWASCICLYCKLHFENS